MRVRTVHNTRVAVILPAYNEAASVASVVTAIRREIPTARIVVVDDGSSDDSARMASGAGADVLSLPYNLGIGAAVQTGYLFATEAGFDVVARLDSDGQHNPMQLTSLIDPIIAGQADVVIGSRFLTSSGYQASLSRAVGTKVFAVLVSFITRQRFTDTTSGFQAANQAAARFLATHMPTDYPEIEGLVMLCRAGFRVREVAVTMRPRKSGHSSITPLRSAYYVLKVTLAVLVSLFQPVPGMIEDDDGAR